MGAAAAVDIAVWCGTGLWVTRSGTHWMHSSGRERIKRRSSSVGRDDDDDALHYPVRALDRFADDALACTKCPAPFAALVAWEVAGKTQVRTAADVFALLTGGAAEAHALFQPRWKVDEGWAVEGTAVLMTTDKRGCAPWMRIAERDGDCLPLPLRWGGPGSTAAAIVLGPWKWALIQTPQKKRYLIRVGEDGAVASVHHVTTGARLDASHAAPFLGTPAEDVVKGVRVLEVAWSVMASTLTLPPQQVSL